MRYTSRSSIAATVAFAVLSGCAAETARWSGEAPPATVPAETASSLALQVEPFADLYFRVRAYAANVVEADPDLQPIVEAWLPAQDEIGTFGGFRRFDLGER